MSNEVIGANILCICKDHALTVIKVKIEALADISFLQLFHVDTQVDLKSVCRWISFYNYYLQNGFNTIK